MASLAAFGLKALIAACGLAFLLFLALLPTNQYDHSTVPDSLAVSNLEGRSVLAMVFTWGTVLVATLATLLLRRAGRQNRAPAPSTAASGVKRALAWQLPPRAFLASWCGGLSVGDALLVLAWLAVNAWWLGLTLRRNLDKAIDSLGWQERVGKAGLSFGQLLAPNLMLLFMPVPHTSLFPWLTGLSRNQLIRYHRWMGHGTMWILTAHAVLYYVYWATSKTAGGFWDNFSLWRDRSEVSNLAGSLAFFFVLALWATALTWVRRRFYTVFFRFHIVCFAGFFLLSCAHYSSCWLYFAPGLLLYATDLALRAGQLANATTVTAASVEEHAAVATIQMKADKALALRPLQEVWLMVPSISRFQWHPFTVAGGSADGVLTLHVKRYGPFTKALLNGLRRRRPTTVRVAGPIGCETTAGCQLLPSASWEQHEVLVLFGGGVGMTALLSVLRAMAERRAAGSAAGLPRRVYCIWTARTLGEFKLLDASLLHAAAQPNSWLQLCLHHTVGQSMRSLEVAPLAPSMTARFSFVERSERRSGDTEDGGASSSQPSPASSKEVQLAKTDLGLERTSADGSTSSGSEGLSTARGPAGMPPRLRAVHPHCDAGSSPFFWSLLRPLQPKSFGAAHLAAVYLLTYLGALCAVLLAASYASQNVQRWQAGMLYCGLLTAMALGLPFGLAVFPVHAARYLRASAAARRCGPEAQPELVAPFQDEVDEPLLLDRGTLRLRGSGTALPVHAGRPEFEGLLQQIDEECPPTCGTIGVYVGGPKGLNTAVQLAVSRLNGRRSAAGTYFELHREAVEL